MENIPLSYGQIGLTDGSGVDPYARWADSSNFLEYRLRRGESIETGLVDCIIELKSEARFSDLVKQLGPDAILIKAYIGQPLVKYVTGSLSLDSLKRLATPKDNVVSRYCLAAPLKAPRSRARVKKSLASLPASNLDLSDPFPMGYAGKKVLLAAIDDGCPFAHSMFRPLGPRLRLRALWDQDRKPDFATIGHAPKGVGYGAVAQRSDISKLILKHTKGQEVDQDACYHALGYSSAIRARSHGAHSIGMIFDGAKYDQLGPYFVDDGANPHSDFVFVQLPRDVMAVPFHGARLRSLLDAIVWIAKQARSDEDVVINVPYGSFLGPHDGTGIFTSALDSLIDSFRETAPPGRELKISMSSGNEFQSHQHWSVPSIKKKEPEALTLRLAPGSEIPTFVEIWLPKGATAKVSVWAPNSKDPVFKDVGPASSYVWPCLSDARATILRTGYGAPSECVLLRFAPTLTNGLQATSYSGDWKITVEALADIMSPIHAYVAIARGGLGSLRRANQSRFFKSKEKSMGDIAGAGTLQDAATGKYTLVVGAYNRWKVQKEKAATWYTSGGPARGGIRDGTASPSGIKPINGPNTSMPSEANPLRPGFRNAGTRSASTFRMNGTSVAAAYFSARLGTPDTPQKVYPTPSDETSQLGDGKIAFINL